MQQKLTIGGVILAEATGNDSLREVAADMLERTSERKRRRDRTRAAPIDDQSHHEGK